MSGEGSPIEHRRPLDTSILGPIRVEPNAVAERARVVREALRSLDRDYLGYPREVRILAFDLANTAPDEMLAKLGRLLK